MPNIEILQRSGYFELPLLPLPSCSLEVDTQSLVPWDFWVRVPKNGSLFICLNNKFSQNFIFGGCTARLSDMKGRNMVVFKLSFFSRTVQGSRRRCLAQRLRQLLWLAETGTFETRAMPMRSALSPKIHIAAVSVIVGVDIAMFLLRLSKALSTRNGKNVKISLQPLSQLHLCAVQPAKEFRLHLTTWVVRCLLWFPTGMKSSPKNLQILKVVAINGTVLVKPCYLFSGFEVGSNQRQSIFQRCASMSSQIIGSGSALFILCFWTSPGCLQSTGCWSQAT